MRQKANNSGADCNITRIKKIINYFFKIVFKLNLVPYPYKTSRDVREVKSLISWLGCLRKHRL